MVEFFLDFHGTDLPYGTLDYKGQGPSDDDSLGGDSQSVTVILPELVCSALHVLALPLRFTMLEA